MKCSLTAKQIELHRPKQTSGKSEPFHKVKKPSFLIIDCKWETSVPYPVDYIRTLHISNGYPDNTLAIPEI